MMQKSKLAWSGSCKKMQLNLAIHRVTATQQQLTPIPANILTPSQLQMSLIQTLWNVRLAA